VRSEIRRIALQNASEHGGSTRDKIVLAKLLGQHPECRNDVKEVMSHIPDIVHEINSMSVQEQMAELKKYPQEQAGKPRHYHASLQENVQISDSVGTQVNHRRNLNEKISVKSELDFLPPLQNTENGVVTRFPPEPNGYPHIGHAKAAIINEEYAKMYNGKKILRMDDTNPENERLEYYAAIKVGLDWLGIKYDVIKNTSDDMEMLYTKADDIISGSKAYVCTCKRDTIGKNRRDMKSCKCSMETDRTGAMWEKMFSKYKQGEAILRYRGNMQSDNTVMRDPILFRIIEARHPLKLNKYRVWPSYDFAVAVEDSLDGVTHAFRSKEYEMRNELYYSILDDLGMRKPQVLEFSRLEFDGMPVSKRVIRPLIDDQKVTWYDDPRLPTLEGMRRRGIRPKAVRQFIASLGFTKSDTFAPFESLEAFNRRIIDAESARLHMVTEPRALRVSGMPGTVQLKNHPGTDSTRNVRVGNTVLIPENDAGGLVQGNTIRLIGIGNVRVESVDGVMTGSYIGDEMLECPKIQWVSQEDAHEIQVVIPSVLFVNDEFNEDSLKILKGHVEPHFREIQDRGMVQFVRFGYCVRESQHRVIMTHK